MNAISAKSAYRIELVTDRRTRKAFLAAPKRIMAADPNYVAPLAMEASKKLDPKSHAFYGHGDAAFWVAFDDADAPAGRISAQINRLHRQKHGPRDGHFGMIAGVDDAALFKELLGTAEAWLRERDCDAAIGPANLSINEEIGLLVEGFETPPMLLMGHDPPWAGGHIEAAGYGAAKDLIAYSYDPTGGPPARLSAFGAKFAEVPGARLRTFDKRHFDRDLKAVLTVFNDAWSENWGSTPMTSAEIAETAHAFKALADFGLIFIAEIGDDVVGMAASLPNINEALAGLNGAGSPLGLLRFLWRLKVGGVKSARVLLMGVSKSVQADLAVGPAVGMALVDALVKAHRDKGYERMELSWVLEDNTPMRRIAEFGGATPYKTYRVYRKDLL